MSCLGKLLDDIARDIDDLPWPVGIRQGNVARVDYLVLPQLREATASFTS